MSPSMPIALAAGALLTSIAAPVAEGQPALAASVELTHCVTAAFTADEIAAGATSEIECFTTELDAIESIGRSVDPYGSPAELLAAAQSLTLAIHYEHSGGLGLALHVTGSTCAGPTLSLGGSGWDNRISSTRTVACGSVKHFDGYSQDGDNHVTGTGLHNLSAAMNDRTSSTSYHP